MIYKMSHFICDIFILFKKNKKRLFMKLFYCLILVFISNYGCNSQDKNKTELNLLVGNIEKNKTNYDIYENIVNILEVFLKEKNNFVLTANHKFNKDSIYTYPFKSLYNIENSLGDGYILTPSLMSLIKTEDNKYIAKISWSSYIEEIKGVYIYEIMNFLIDYQDSDKIDIYNITSYNIKDWKTNIFNEIKYFYENTHNFNTKEAGRMSNFNSSLTDFFDTDLIQFRYIICKNYETLKKIQGYDFTPSMFRSTNIGGEAFLEDNLIFTGNNSEYYPHELVHLYVYKLFGNTNRILNEGIATYLGGAIDLSYSEQLKKIKDYIKNNPSTNFYKNTFDNYYNIDYNTSFMYVGGAFICNVIIKEYGKEKLFEIMKSSKTNEELDFSLKKLFNVKTDTEMDNFLKQKLEEYE